MLFINLKGGYFVTWPFIYFLGHGNAVSFLVAQFHICQVIWQGLALWLFDVWEVIVFLEDSDV